MKKWLITLLCPLLCLAAALGLTACGNAVADRGAPPVAYTVTVTFMNGETEVDTVDVPAGQPVAATTKAVEAPKGQQFSSWQRGGVDWNFTTPVSEDIVLNAAFRDVTAETVNVIYRNGDVVITSRAVEKGTVLTAPAVTPEPPAGKQFRAWQVNGADWDFATPVEADLTLVASFEDAAPPVVPTYTLTFNGADGTQLVKEVAVERGGYLKPGDVPEAPDRSAEHLTFVKWVRADDAAKELNPAGKVVEDVTYIAVYETTRYSVTFTEANGVTTWEGQTVEYGASVKTPELPVGYVIESVKSGGTAFDMATPVTSNLELVITLKRLSHTVTFTGTDGNEIAKVTVPDRGNATIPTPPTGLYYTAVSAEFVKTFDVTEDRTVTLGTRAQSDYKNDTQWINYAEAGDAINGADNRYTADFTTGGWQLKQTPFQKKGAYFTITGDFTTLTACFWVNAKSVGEYNVYVDGVFVKSFRIEAGETAIQTDKTFTILSDKELVGGTHTIKVEVVETGAQWMVIGVKKAPQVKDRYTVTFRNEDGTVFATEEVAAGGTATMPATNPTKEGYVFRGWKHEDATFDSSTVVNKDYTLTPVFAEDTENYAKVDFKADGKAYGKTVYVKKGTAVTAPAENPTKENYKFKHWSLTEGGEAFDFTTAITDDTTIYACFELDAVLHTVTYKDAEGNVLGTADVIDGASAPLPAAPAGYYWTCTMADLANITADKDVVLGRVADSAYAGTATNIAAHNTPADKISQYGIVKGHHAPATVNPVDQSWGLILYQAGQYIEFRADLAGELRFGGLSNKKGLHFVLGLFIDDVLYQKSELHLPQKEEVYFKNLPAGEHTYRVEILSATADEGGDGLNKWSGICWTVIGFREKATPAKSDG